MENISHTPLHLAKVKRRRYYVIFTVVTWYNFLILYVRKLSPRAGS